ncbi:hypothetical protein [Inhella sp.]|uniref:hypothetical protein n=1 Tax=Inhella sp. TaxID=1921806 RepID=UPI0035ADDE5F
MQDSLHCKLRVYAKQAPAGAVPAGFAEFVDSPDCLQHGIAFLRGLYKEVDVWVRELLAPEQQDAMVQAMRAAGVLEPELPSTQRTRRIRRLLRTQVTLESEQLEELRQARACWQCLALSAAELQQLLEGQIAEPADRPTNSPQTASE